MNGCALDASGGVDVEQALSRINAQKQVMAVAEEGFMAESKELGFCVMVSRQRLSKP